MATMMPLSIAIFMAGLQNLRFRPAGSAWFRGYFSIFQNEEQRAAIESPFRAGCVIGCGYEYETRAPFIFRPSFSLAAAA